jgi:hypothetical protein
MSSSAIPPHCPSCGASLKVVKLECPVCKTEVNGEYDLCPVCRLEGDARNLFDLFLKARGNLKRVQRELGLSYPTGRLRIEEMFHKLGHGPAPPDPKVVLEKLRSGEIDVDSAERLLRGETE